jgi:hypothetical protein
MMVMETSFLALPCQQYLAGDAITTTVNDLLGTSPRKKYVLSADPTAGAQK